MARNEKMNGIKIDFVSGIIYINKSFNERANNPMSEEYKLLKEVRNDNPSFKVVYREGKERTSPYKNLKYANMDKYIKVYENSDELLEMFEKVKELSKSQPNPYNFVKGWFKEQFPNYKKIPQFNKDGKLYAFPIPPKAEEAENTKELKEVSNF